MQDRSEPATPRKRRKAREEGQVAKSAELVSCTTLLAGLYAFRTVGPAVYERLGGYLARSLSAVGSVPTSHEGLRSLANDGMLQAGMAALPVVGVVLAVGVTCNIAQVGIHFAPAMIRPKLERLDPMKEVKRLVAPRSEVELAKSFAKFAIVIAIAWSYVGAHLEEIDRLSAIQPGMIGPVVGELLYGMAIRMVGTLTVLAALDYWYQRTSFERTLRMTKQEVKDEMRDSEGNPEIKARIRQRQKEFSRRRMMSDVPKAAVVIMNPTHYAMALKYELGQSGAPTVVAKGRDLIALKIREIAEEHGVPVVVNPPLARSLFDLAEIGDEIPTAMYRAVAEVLSVVWRLNKVAETR